jgi:hypothetical protein
VHHAPASLIKPLFTAGGKEIVMTIEMLKLALGLTFVTFHAYDRFNMPPSNRSSTTAVRYHTAAIGYVAAMLLIYLALVRFPDELLKLFSAEDALKAMKDQIANLSPPFLAALFLTVLLPKIPYLAAVDQWVKMKLQYMAAIPYEARRLSAELARSTFHIQEDVRDAVTQELTKKGFHAKDVLFEKGYTPQYVWTKITTLMLQIKSWEEDHTFAGFVAKFYSDFTAINAKYEKLSQRACNCFRILDTTKEPFDKHGIQTLDGASECKMVFLEHCEDLLKNMYEFMSRGILKCKLTHRSRMEQLQLIGFRELPKPHKLPVTLNQLFHIFVPLNVLLIICFLMSDPFHPVLLVKVMMISTILCVSLICGTYPKSQWKFAHRDDSGYRPVPFYCVAGMMAVFFGITISFVFKGILLGIGEAIKDIQQSYPWMFMAFTTAVTVSYNIDNKPSRLLSLREGVMQAAATMIAAVIICEWLKITRPSRVPSLEYVLPFSGLMGFLIGYYVPHWYRATSDEIEEVQKQTYDLTPYFTNY